MRNNGAIAQLVEQRTENPCVPGSIPGGTTHTKKAAQFERLFLCVYTFNNKLYQIIFGSTKK